MSVPRDAEADGAALALTAREHRRLADVLLAAAHSRRPIEPLSSRYPELTPGDACRIRDRTLAARLARGERLVGAKVAFDGLPSRSRPIAWRLGWLTSGMLLGGDAVALGELIRPRVEAKLGFRLGTALSGPEVTAERLLAATERVLPALEVLDERYGTSQVSALDAVADNCGAALLRLGPGAPAPEQHDAEQLDCTIVALGAGRTPRPETAAPSPLAAAVWLAQRLVDAGRPPGAGTLLLAAATARPVELRRARHVRARCPGAGEVALHASEGEDRHER